MQKVLNFGSLNIDYVLHLWLVEVPDYTALFIILILVDSLVGNLFGTPLMTSLSATGKIRNYQIVVSAIILCIVPVGYVVLRLGCDASSVFYITIVFTAISGFARFLFCRKQIGYSLSAMLRNVLLPVFGMTAVALPLPIFIKLEYFKTDTWLSFILLSLVAVVMTFVASWFVGLKANERNMLVTMVKNKIHR